VSIGNSTRTDDGDLERARHGVSLFDFARPVGGHGLATEPVRAQRSERVGTDSGFPAHVLVTGCPA
jgi:hypothetical protein